MTTPDGENGGKRGVGKTLLSGLFFLMDRVIGFVDVTPRGSPSGRATEEAGPADRRGDSGVARPSSRGRTLATGTAVIGAIFGFSWMIIVSVALPPHPVVNYIALWGGLASGVGIWAALILRAKHTGKFDK